MGNLSHSQSSTSTSRGPQYAMGSAKCQTYTNQQEKKCLLSHEIPWIPLRDIISEMTQPQHMVGSQKT
jgi:hypothetical protein